MAVTIEQMDAEELPGPAQDTPRPSGNAPPSPQSEAARRMMQRQSQRAAERQWRRMAD